MIKRPLNPQFSTAVLEGRKFTTIREKPWPVGVPIMLYNWSGLPYRSKQVDVCPVKVIFTQPITITHWDNGIMLFDYPCNWPLWEGEGFDSGDAMDDWFRPLVKPGQTVFKHLMQFKLFKP